MNQDEEFKQQIQANDVGERMSEFAQYKKWKDEHDPSKPLAKTFCPNCERETECTHAAELYECEECGEDFAKYIVSRNPSVSDVSAAQDVLTDIETEGEFVVCQKCRTIVPPQMMRYQMYYCPNCGRKIIEKDDVSQRYSHEKEGE